MTATAQGWQAALVALLTATAVLVAAGPASADPEIIEGENGGGLYDSDDGGQSTGTLPGGGPLGSGGGNQEASIGGPSITCSGWSFAYEFQQDLNGDGIPAILRRYERTCTLHGTGESFRQTTTVCMDSPSGCIGVPRNIQEAAQQQINWAALFPGWVQSVYAQINPPVLQARHTFEREVDGRVRAVVNAETWFWVDGAEPMVVTDTNGPMQVTVTATPTALHVTPGDGSGEFTCTNWRPYNFDVGYQTQAGASDACSHIYEVTAESNTATVSVEWEFSFTGFAPGLGTVSNTLGAQTVDSAATFAITELQSVIVD